MESDLSDVEVEEEVYAESPGLFDDDLDGQEIEEDDDYQYTPEYEEDEDSVQVKRSGRSRRQPTRLEEDEDQTNGAKRTMNRQAPAEEDEMPTSSKRRKATTIDLQSYEEEEDEEGEGEDPQKQVRTNTNKMMLELMDGTSPRKRDRLTEEELQLRRAENARKRKNMSEKKLEEEKQDTINKLLRRRAGKSRSNVTLDNGDSDDESTYLKPRRAYQSEGLVRTIRAKDTDLYCTY